jgi:hypothetical protein
MNAMRLEPHDCVPAIPIMQAFPMYYAGITIQESMEDISKAAEAWDKFLADFDPDMTQGPLLSLPSKVMEALDLKWFRWPGHGIEEDKIYQFAEGEFMKGDEYDEFVFDPTHFMLTKWLPRSLGALKAFEKLPPIRDTMWFGWFSIVGAFGDPEVRQAFETLMNAAEDLAEYNQACGDYVAKMKTMGFPSSYGGFSWAPFDLVGDTLRGTHGVLTDMFRRPEELKKAVEKMIPISVEMGVGPAVASGIPLVWIWLHKGCDGFMSDEQFAEFYWPSLKAQMEGIIEGGATPVLYCEGDYTPRLKYLAEMPPGKCVYHFETIDMVKAKEALMGIACLMGGIPNSLLVGGSPEEVREYCQKTIEIAGQDGGYIIASGALIDEANPENLKMMFDVAHDYEYS